MSNNIIEVDAAIEITKKFKISIQDAFQIEQGHHEYAQSVKINLVQIQMNIKSLKKDRSGCRSDISAPATKTNICLLCEICVRSVEDLNCSSGKERQ
ncbi:hypothetical protein KFK09_013266 [Dendrobium nobile]|uniref:Uncharacterized protein n=1 Tax=Dendrobium nobile TaxID=94219 RepID=A0A8T3B9N0_DENNO|nr:hypothetical protein KFK09_013266 [Dendrobium nobile]